MRRAGSLNFRSIVRDRIIQQDNGRNWLQTRCYFIQSFRYFLSIVSSDTKAQCTNHEYILISACIIAPISYVCNINVTSRERNQSCSPTVVIVAMDFVIVPFLLGQLGLLDYSIKTHHRLLSVSAIICEGQIKI